MTAKKKPPKKKTGGTWDPAERNVYFIASNTVQLDACSNVTDHFLIAVNEIATVKDKDLLLKWLDEGRKVFIDSGIFWLANGHARRNGISMDDALRLAPEELDDFEKLEEKYIKLLTEVGDRAWCYIEMDQGGKENKRRTRARHEAMGLRPTPVYHPIVDGWEYFDELAEVYDRLCFGNVVQANAPTRKRLVATAWERRNKYPDLWIHLLGLTPNALLNAFPIDSADSSSWLAAVRWNGFKPNICNNSFGTLPQNFQYKLHTNINYDKALQMAACGFTFQVRNWRRLVQDYRDDIGCDDRMEIRK